MQTGKVTHFIAIKQDISERRNLQQQLQQAQKMESIGRLAGGIAHDFNNLLQAITGFSSILLAELGEGDPRRGDVEEIDRAAQRAVALTRQLLAFSRKQKMELARWTVNHVVQGTEKMLRRLIGENIALGHRSWRADLPPVLADPGQLEQVIVNLAVNARDAMPEGGRLILRTRAR
jgi:two-component system cell cycle sensor histidine kinase/response regulator CckA